MLLESRVEHQKQKISGDEVKSFIRHPHMDFCAGLLGLVRCLYVDSYATISLDAHTPQRPNGSAGEPVGEPHDVMARVKLIRIWANVKNIEKHGLLASRTTSQLQVDFQQFETLSTHLYEFLRMNAAWQVASRIEQNGMILSSLKLIYDMILYGFVMAGAKSEDELASVDVPSRLQRPHSTKRTSLFHARRSLFASTRGGYKQLLEPSDEEPPINPPMMDPQQVPTARDFIPILLRVLDGSDDRFDEPGHDDPTVKRDDRMFQQWKTVTHDTILIMQCKLWACKVLQLICDVRVDIRLSRLLGMYHDTYEAAQRSSESWPKETRDDVSERLNVIMTTLKIPQLQSLPWFLGVLHDTTLYDLPELPEAATGLLIRHFQQKHVLSSHGKQVQVPPYLYAALSLAPPC